MLCADKITLPSKFIQFIHCNAVPSLTFICALWKCSGKAKSWKIEDFLRRKNFFWKNKCILRVGSKVHEVQEEKIDLKLEEIRRITYIIVFFPKKIFFVKLFILPWKYCVFTFAGIFIFLLALGRFLVQ